MGHPTECQKIIRARQAEIDADEEEIAIVREAFAVELRAHGHDLETEIVFITSAKAVQLLEKATNEKCAVNKASAALAALSIPEIRRSKKDEKEAGNGLEIEPLVKP